MVLLRSDALNSKSSARVSASVEIVGDLLDCLEPLVVLAQNELCLSDLVSDRQPPIPDIVIGPKQLQPLTA